MPFEALPALFGLQNLEEKYQSGPIKIDNIPVLNRNKAGPVQSFDPQHVIK
jgi:hypothetical protein